MAWNGSGSFSRTNGFNTGTTTWAQDAAGGVAILASRHDTHDQDLATGINACLTKNGENTPSANLPMGGFKHTNVAVASSRTDYARASQIADCALNWAGTSGGSANAQTVALSPAVTALAAGVLVYFIAGYTNTGATTLQLNSTAATALRYQNRALSGGEVQAGLLYAAQFDGSVWQLLNPGGVPQTWTPTYGGNGSLTYTSVSTTRAEYMRVGSLCYFWLEASGTTGGVTDNQLTISAPVTAAHGSGNIFQAAWLEGGTNNQGGFGYLATTTSLIVKKDDGSNWALMAGVAFTMQGVYEV